MMFPWEIKKKEISYRIKNLVASSIVAATISMIAEESWGLGSSMT